MKNVTYRWNTFQLYDYRGVEEHLSAMAAKGWRLEKAGNQLWTYRRAEPAKVRYAVTYSYDRAGFRLFFESNADRNQHQKRNKRYKRVKHNDERHKIERLTLAEKIDRIGQRKRLAQIGFGFVYQIQEYVGKL